MVLVLCHATKTVQLDVDFDATLKGIHWFYLLFGHLGATYNVWAAYGLTLMHRACNASHSLCSSNKQSGHSNSMLFLQKLFWHLDRDQDSKLGLQDVTQTLAKGGFAVPPEEEVIALFNAADVNHTSYIDFPKFVAVLIDKHHLGRCAGFGHTSFPRAAS